MFMDHVEGTSLGDCLNSLSPQKTRTIIYEWANYAWELTRVSFPAIGCLGLDHASQSVEVQQFISSGSVDQGRDTIGSYYRGPYLSVSDYLFGISNLKKMAPLDDKSYERFSFGTYLESMIPFALKPEYNRGPFYLVHDDFNVQNILIDPQSGHITAILDWDYACIKPLQSLLAYPDSLRWDILSAVTPNIEQYQIEWSRQWRKHWADAMLLASQNVDTGCIIDIRSYLNDSPFFALLERGLGESWREVEAMKFCNAVVYGKFSADVVKLGGKSMRNGPWMALYGERAGYGLPSDLRNKPVPLGRPPRRQSIALMLKMGKASGEQKSPKKIKTCIWEWKIFRDRILHRKRLRRFMDRLCQNPRRDDEDTYLSKEHPEKPRTSTSSDWWTTLGRKFYSGQEGTLRLE
jgi:Phosphotransferase enzyme family